MTEVLDATKIDKKCLRTWSLDMSSLGKLTLRNYRCFDWSHPAVIEFGDGFTAYVGTNNSGKSTALRSIYELRLIFGGAFLCLVPKQNYQQNLSVLGVSDVAEVANDNDPTRFQFDIEISGDARSINSTDLLAIGVLFEYEVSNQRLSVKKVRTIDQTGEIREFDRPLITNAGMGEKLPRISYQDRKAIDYSQLMEFATDLQHSRYFPAFRNAINEGAGNYYDIPIGTALVSTWDGWKAGNSRSQKIAISNVESEIASLLGFNSLQINADQSGKTLDIIINGKPQKLYEVGAGVAQLIIVLSASLISKPPYILIDEPELSLHPALQINFLATLGSYSKKGLLFSTHSISLARSTAVRIYAVKRIRNGVSEMHIFGDDKINYGGWLGELSYSSRVELGCEGLLLVEGPTDILLFQEFLRKLGKDHQYVLMHLGGSSWIRGGVTPQISELSRIIDPSKIRIFIDSERDAADAPLAVDRAAFVEDCKGIGLNVQVAQRRATENYFEGKGIQKVLGGGYEPLAPYQKLKESVKPWHKSDNWRIARETDFEDIKDTDLGNFLSSL